MRMWTPRGTRHCFAECSMAMLPSLLFPTHSLDSPPIPQLGPHLTLLLLSPWRNKGWRENPAGLIFNKWLQVKRNIKEALKTEKNSWPYCVEAERKNPTHLAWESPEIFWIFVLCVNLAWWSHHLSPPLPCLSHCKEERSRECRSTPAHCLATPLPQPSSSESLPQMALPESQLSTHCPQRRKCRHSQVFDHRHLLEGQCSISCTENKLFQGIKNSTTYCRNLMGNYVWGNLHNLRYANSPFDCNTNPWSSLLPASYNMRGYKQWCVY